MIHYAVQLGRRIFVLQFSVRCFRQKIDGLQIGLFAQWAFEIEIDHVLLARFDIGL